MSRVYLVLPHEDLQDGFFFARKCVLQCFARGETPLNVNFMYGNVLDLSAIQEAEMADRAAAEWMGVSTKVVCYTDRDVDLKMNAELLRARTRKLPIEFRRLLGGRPSSEGMHFRGIHHSPEDCALCLGPQRVEELKKELAETSQQKKEE